MSSAIEHSTALGLDEGLDPALEQSTFTGKFKNIFPDLFNSLSLTEINKLDGWGKDFIPLDTLHESDLPPGPSNLGNEGLSPGVTPSLTDSKILLAESSILQSLTPQPLSCPFGEVEVGENSGLFSDPLPFFCGGNMILDFEFPPLPNVTIRKKEGGRRKKEMARASGGVSVNPILTFDESQDPCDDNGTSTIFRPLRAMQARLGLT